MMKWYFLFFNWFLLGFAHLGYAQTMTVDADKFELHQENKRADFYGHVVVNRLGMVLKADKVTVWYQEKNGKNELQLVDAVGNVVITTKTKQGSADKASFNADSELLVLSGKAKVTNENSVLEGEVIEYNTATENIKVLKGKSEEQVKFTFDEEAK